MMKLSEAISLGATLRPQAYGTSSMIVGDTIWTCALGGAAEAAGLIKITGTVVKPGMMDIREHFPILNTMWVSPGAFGVCSLCDTIIRLNDSFHWTRELIAQWVESVENRLEQQVAPQPVEWRTEEAAGFADFPTGPKLVGAQEFESRFSEEKLALQASAAIRIGLTPISGGTPRNRTVYGCFANNPLTICYLRPLGGRSRIRTLTCYRGSVFETDCRPCSATFRNWWAGRGSNSHAEALVSKTNVSAYSTTGPN